MSNEDKYAILNYKFRNKLESYFAEKAYGLPEEVQMYIRDNINTPESHNLLTFLRTATKRPGMTRRDTMYNGGKRFMLRVRAGKEQVLLTDDQLKFLVDNAGNMTHAQLVAHMFPDEKDVKVRNGILGRLAYTLQYLDPGRSVSSHAIKRQEEDDEEMERGGIAPPPAPAHITHVSHKKDYNISLLGDVDYVPPSGMDELIAKINEADPNANFQKGSISGFQRKCIANLRHHLSDFKFLLNINGYKKPQERKLFELEFIKSIYDKVDMIPDDIAAAMALAQAYVREIQIQETINLLDARMKSALDGDISASSAFSEDLKSKTNELSKCQIHITKLQTQLNSARSKRLEAESKHAQSLAPYINKVADENFRKAMIRAKQEYESKALKGELDKLEAMEQEVGEAHGISISEVLGFKHDILP